MTDTQRNRQTDEQTDKQTNGDIHSQTSLDRSMREWRMQQLLTDWAMSSQTRRQADRHKKSP